MGTHGTSPRRRTAVTRAANAVRRVVRALRASSHATHTKLGLSGAQLFVLHVLAAGEALSIAELAERTATDPSSVSVVAGRLVDAALAERRASADDARRAELTITAAGRAALRKAPLPVQTQLIEALAQLPVEKLAALVDGLEAVVAAMGLAEAEAPMFFEEESAPPRRRRKKKVADDPERR